MENKASRPRYKADLYEPTLEAMRLALFCWICIGWVAPAGGQPSHLEAYQTMAVRCLSPLADSLQAYRILPLERMPFLVPALAAAGARAQHSVFLADSVAPNIPGIRIDVRQAGVTLTRTRRRTVNRRVTLALDATLLAPDGRVIDTRTCNDAFEDRFPRSIAASLTTNDYAETRASTPEARWLRRILEPTLAVGATVLGAYLFFTLRSERAEDS
ncbi:MAG: hypothetical protein SH809_10590 [Rhodothermales bacterium]|nr:hypothetical protein [Rhodothermales bacterium]